MKPTNDKTTEIRKEVQEVLDIIKCLQNSMEAHLFVWDFWEEKFYFAHDISKYFFIREAENGYSEEEWKEVVYHPDLGSVIPKIQAIRETEKDIQDVEYRLLDREGNPVWVSSQGIVYREGILLGCISESALKHQIDSLTGLRKSDQMYIDLDQAVQDAETGYLLVLDMDDFQTINTRYGRAYGNRVLQQVGRFLEESMGEDSRAYRLEGDRFGAKLPNVEKEMVKELVRSFQGKLSSDCTISVGAVQYPMGRIVDSSMLYQYAEVSLNQAKEEGKNTLAFFDEKSYEKYLYRINLIEEMRGSVRNDFEGFELYYQPQISKERYEIYGAEALLRYHSYDYGIVSPVDFIPILEQTGMIHAVGKWVIHNGFQQCREWRKYKKDFIISINLSYIQLKDEMLGEYILDELKAAHIPGSAVILELTESVQLQDFEEFNKLFYLFGKYGIKISIDDFGTGYSSLGYLKSLEIDEIKIDRCFVSQIQSSAYNYRLLSNIIELAYSLDIQVCCEGVEDEEELEVLEYLSPKKIQGYLFGSPVTAEKFEESFLRDTEKNQTESQRRLELYDRLQYSESGQPSYNRIDNDLTNVLDEMEEMVYVSDLKTHEMYYLNRAGKRLTEVYDYKGRKCYKVLQGRNEPCEFCTNHLLQEHSFYEWSMNNKYLGCRIKIKDKFISWEGKKARLGIGVKLAEEKQQQQQKQIRQQMETELLNAISSYHENSDFSQGIKDFLAFLGDFYKAERSYIFIYNSSENMWENIYEWCEVRAQSYIFKEAGLKQELISRWIPILEKGESVCIEGTGFVGENQSEEIAMLKEKRISRLMVCPFIHDGNLWGFIGIDNGKNMADEDYLLQEAAKYIALEFVRHGFYDASQEEKSGVLMNLMQEKEILDLTQLGVWIIQVDTNTHKNYMYMNSTLKKIMGIEKNLTTEEAYNHWYNRINDGYYKYVNTGVERMLEGKETISLEYTWNHPNLGEVPVRCIGKLSSEQNGIYILKGYHRMLSDIQQMQFMNYNNTPETFEYNEKKHTIYFHTGRNLIDGRAKKEDGFPYSWIRKGIVHPYFIDMFEQMFTNVKDKKESQSDDILLLNKEKQFAWYHIETRHLGESEQDIHTLIVVLHPIMEKRDIQLQHVWKNDFYQAMLSETSAFVEVDLETGMIQDGGGFWKGYMEESRDGALSYTQVFQKHLPDVIRDEDFDIYCGYLDMENIKKQYLEGNATVQYAFERKMENNQMQWMQLVIHVFQERISEHMYALLYLKDIDAVKRREIEREKAASWDSLTNTLNRRSFQWEVENYMQTSEPDEKSALLMLDLDNFKLINDTCGHLAGDELLVKFARVLKKTFRKTDLIGRLGGDEFVVFVKNFKEKQVLSTRIEELKQQLLEDENEQIFCSIGIDIVTSENFDYNTAVKHADKALYISKDWGKNSYTYFDEI